MPGKPATEAAEITALHAAPLASFVATRKEAARRLRAAGHAAAAARVIALPKPTPAAWAVNALFREEPKAFAKLLATGKSLRSALRAAFTGRGEPAAAAMLQKEQRDEVASLVEQAEPLLVAGGVRPSQVLRDRIATTLRTLSTTSAWGEDEPGRLTKEQGEADLASIATLLVDGDAAARRPANAEAAPAPAKTAKSRSAEAKVAKTTPAKARRKRRQAHGLRPGRRPRRRSAAPRRSPTRARRSRRRARRRRTQRPRRRTRRARSSPRGASTRRRRRTWPR